MRRAASACVRCILRSIAQTSRSTTSSFRCDWIWAGAEDLTLDRRDVAEGDLFGCRYELFRTDPRKEPRKTKWEVELNIRLADPPGTEN